MLAGLTKQGRPSSATTRLATDCGSSATSRSWTGSHRVWGIPWLPRMVLAMTLSIVAAEPSTPAPT